jgi:type IV pilus assembly protein PilC
MAIFNYQAQTPTNKIIEGSLEVENEDIARAMLLEQGVTILALEEQRSASLSGLGNITIFAQRISKKDIVVFSRQLAVMVEAQIPIVQALKIIAQQTENQRLQTIIRQVYTAVAAGARLSDVLANYPKVFDGFYVNMVRSGETSGRLSEVLDYLATQFEKDYDLFRRVRGALMYPVTVVVAMLIAAVVILIYVIPRLVNVFETMGVEVPFTTQILIYLSEFTRNYWFIILVGLAMLFVLVRGYVMTYVGRLTVSKLRLKIPVFGSLFRYIYLLQMTRGLFTLLRGGINLYDSLGIVQGVVQDIQFQNMVKEVRDGVRDGSPLARELSQYQLVPDLVANMVVIGEQTGRLEYMLEKVSEYYAKEIDATTANIMTLIEPLVMVLLGIGVALIVSAVFLPLYSIPSF